MKPLYLCIFLVATFTSCFLWKPSAEKLRREAVKDSIAADKACMDSLKAFVAKNWTYHQEGDYYSCTKEFRRDIAYTCIPCHGVTDKSIRFERCLALLDTVKIIQLFGKPRQRDGSFFHYSLISNQEAKEMNSVMAIGLKKNAITTIWIVTASQ
jgi:hypothetical protein